jgi:micrococcal nuclease
MYEYKANLIKVVDGDTVDVDIDLGFGVWLKNERVRIMGIDTPESRTRDPVEKLFGLAAKDRVKELLQSNVILKTFAAKDGEDMKGKFGRILGDFYVSADKKLLTEVMIDEGHAVPYHGQSKDDIQAMHLSNRERLVNKGVVILEDILDEGIK